MKEGMNMDRVVEKEVLFGEEDLIVSMTDAKGKITYVNDIFCKIAGYTREELLGQPHNLVRHSSMPRVVFKLLWESVLSGKSITAFVKNKTKGGDYYWVKAYIAPIVEKGEIVSITSYRRPIGNFTKTEISKVYKVLLEYERTHTLEESMAFFLAFLKERHLSYAQFIDRLALERSISSPEALDIDVDGYFIDHVIFKTAITRSIALGKKEVEVTDPCCCNFGKKLKTLEGMAFTSHPSWSRVHQYHNHVHGLMRDYVSRAGSNASANELESILKNVETDTHKLFDTLNEVIDTYVDEKGM
jgi:PAS domain S-box-containing protein